MKDSIRILVLALTMFGSGGAVAFTLVIRERVKETQRRLDALPAAEAGPELEAEQIKTLRQRERTQMTNEMMDARNVPDGYTPDEHGVFRIGDRARIYYTLGTAGVRFPWCYDVWGKGFARSGVCKTFEEALAAVRPHLGD